MEQTLQATATVSLLVVATLAALALLAIRSATRWNPADMARRVLELQVRLAMAEAERNQALARQVILQARVDLQANTIATLTAGWRQPGLPGGAPLVDADEVAHATR